MVLLIVQLILGSSHYKALTLYFCIVLSIVCIRSKFELKAVRCITSETEFTLIRMLVEL